MKFRNSKERESFFINYIIVYEGVLRKYLWRYTYDDNIRDDVMQNTMMKAWIKLDSLKDPQKSKSWLFTIALNEVKLYFRNNKDDRVFFGEGAEGEPIVEIIEAVEESALDVIIKSYQEQVALMAFEKLSKEERRLIGLRYLEDMKQREMADVLGMKIGTISSQLCRAVKKFRMIYVSMENEERQ